MAIAWRIHMPDTEAKMRFKKAVTIRQQLKDNRFANALINAAMHNVASASAASCEGSEALDGKEQGESLGAKATIRRRQA